MIKKYLFSEQNERDDSFKRKIRSSNSNSLILKSRIQKLKEIYKQIKKDPIYIILEKEWGRKPTKGINYTLDDDENTGEGGTQDSFDLNQPESETNVEENKEANSSIKQIESFTKLKSSTTKKIENRKNEKKMSSFVITSQPRLHEITLISRLRETKRVMFFHDKFISNSEDIGFNLFAYEYDQKKDFKIYHPRSNFDESLRDYLKFLRGRERKLRKNRMSLKKGMKAIMVKTENEKN